VRKIIIKVLLSHLIVLLFLWSSFHKMPTKISNNKPISIKSITVATPLPKKTQKTQKTQKKKILKIAAENKTAKQIKTNTNSKKKLLKKLQASLASISEEGPFKSSHKKEMQNPSEIEALQIDQIKSRSSFIDRSYETILINKLKSSLVLPDFGQLRLSLTLNSDGSIFSYKILNSENHLNSNYIEKALKNITFLPFNKSFASQEQHTFSIVLNNQI